MIPVEDTAVEEAGEGLENTLDSPCLLSLLEEAWRHGLRKISQAPYDVQQSRRCGTENPMADKDTQ